MNKFVINGGKRLSGVIHISGAKNAALPIIAASILSKKGKNSLYNVPIVDDVFVLTKMLKKLGAKINMTKGSAIIDASKINSCVLPLQESKKMRASILLAGPLLTKHGRAVVTEPGGCVIGKRPIDFHLAGFKALGAEIKELNNGFVKIEAARLEGNTVRFPFPSVTATENIMMAACYAKGKTTIENAAKEPEIIDLAIFLKSMGAIVKGAGTSTINIEGVDELSATSHNILPDRIETGTYIIASAITGGDVTLKNTRLDILESVSSILKQIGVKIEENGEGVQVTSSQDLRPIDIITEVYPGFPTDMQAIITPLLCLADGESTIKETIFENRFNHVPELRKMGAEISVRDDTIYITKVKKLKGSEVNSLDLRSGSSLIIAGLVAEGTTIVNGVEHILRGYENPIKKLNGVGADIHSIKR